MANHAFLISPRLPTDPEVIDADIREFVADQFPTLNVWHDDWNWLVTHQEKEEAIYHAVNFWIREEKDDYILEDIDGLEPDSNVLEFRHGHGPDLYWWIECRVRQFFAKKYGCLAYDEGIGQYDEKDEEFPTFADYVKITTRLPNPHPNYPTDEEREKREEEMYYLKLWMMKDYFERGGFPAKLKPLMGVDLDEIPEVKIEVRGDK